jgi:predicted nucleic acid-binding protein
LKSATAAFWDASALVPICVHQPGTREARAYLAKFNPIIWWGSLIEVQSAICRLSREDAISDANKQGALLRLRALSRMWREVLPDNDLRELAIAVLEKYSLRAGDSLQLAAALIWCQQRPSKRVFICTDRKLGAAAAKAGFSVLEF